jgi:hypothetical protein
MLFELFFWWYGKGWLNAWKTARDWVTKVQMEFSMPELFKSLFSPWKRIVSLPGRSMDEKIRAMIDNLISRVIGFLVRFLALIAAAICIVLAAIAGLARAIAWPLIPPAVIYLIYRGFAG